MSLTKYPQCPITLLICLPGIAKDTGRAVKEFAGDVAELSNKIKNTYETQINEHDTTVGVPNDNTEAPSGIVKFRGALARLPIVKTATAE